MEKEPERSRFVYDDEDDIQVYDMSELEIVKPTKPIAASAISDFKIDSESSEEK
jgi:hypothetical protein